MKTLRVLMWIFASVAVLVLVGCFGSPHRTVYVAEPQVKYVIVREAPPPIIREVRPSPPSRGHIWIDGSWHWDGRKYVWNAGRWTRPPHARAVWVPPRYEKAERGYRYAPGRWGPGPPRR